MRMTFSLIAVLAVLSFSAYAQKVIQMEKDGGVFKIPCLVNGVKMKFIFDTGAATVCISETMAEYLFENEYLSKEDILGKGTSSLADGRIVEHININLRDIEIVGLHLTNVKAIVVKGQKAPLLLGQTAIQELGRISIDGDKLIIHNIDNEYSEQDIEKLFELANKYIENKSYAAASECLLKIDNNRGLTEYGLSLLAYCYRLNNQFKECLEVCNRWIKEFENSSTDEQKSQMYDCIGICYYFGLKEYNQALLWFQKVIPIYENEKDLKSSAWAKYLSASCYFELNRNFEAKRMFKNAINDECTHLGITLIEISVNKAKEKGRLGLMFFEFAFCCFELNEDSNAKELLRLGAKCGYNDAIEMCKKLELNYWEMSVGIIN